MADQQLRQNCGTADRPLRCFTTGQDAFTHEGIASLEKSGVTDVVIGFLVSRMEPDKPLEEKKILHVAVVRQRGYIHRGGATAGKLDLYFGQT